MDDGIYKGLARHLDDLPGGFPPTESGVELRILRRLFSPEEARLACHLTLIPEEARVIARRAKIPAAEASRQLEEMARKGLIFNMTPNGRPTLYMASQYVIGIWEYHVNDLNPELIKDMDEYLPTLVDAQVWQKAPQLRTIPVNRSIEAKLEVLPFERAEELVASRHKLLVAPCICRRERSLMGEGCDKPEEACLIFGKAAEYYQRNGLGRLIEKQEALDILRGADEAGLVLQPGNAQRAANICCCCGCCCAVLRTLKEYPKPAALVSSPFCAALNRDACRDCGKCIDRCQLDALRRDGGKASLDSDRCIGCGLCVSTCPAGALTLVRKPDSVQPKVPRNLIEAATKLGRERGKMGPFRVAHMRLKSKFDRLMALR